MIGYLFALLPLYVLVYLPLSHILTGGGGNDLQSHDSSHDISLNESLIATNEPLSCPDHRFKTYILSYEPLVVYIEGFLAESEAEHLLRVSEDKYTPSTVSTGPNTSIEPSIRLSSVALLDRDDIVRCIEHRAREFQGSRPGLHIERLRTQRYEVGGHYKHHFDWSGAGRARGGRGGRGMDRVSTFMVYVGADCEGGGTHFPRLRMPDTSSGKWCSFLDCHQDTSHSDTATSSKTNQQATGITFKPMAGNAVFWLNVSPADGRGYEETWHAGLPVTRGTKVGLNIWSWGSAN